MNGASRSVYNFSKWQKAMKSSRAIKPQQCRQKIRRFGTTYVAKDEDRDNPETSVFYSVTARLIAWEDFIARLILFHDVIQITNFEWDRVGCQRWIDRNVIGSVHDLFWGAIPAFAWGHWRNPLKVSVKMASLRPENRTQDFRIRNMSTNHYTWTFNQHGMKLFGCITNSNGHIQTNCYW